MISTIHVSHFSSCYNLPLSLKDGDTDGESFVLQVWYFCTQPGRLTSHFAFGISNSKRPHDVVEFPIDNMTLQNYEIRNNLNSLTSAGITLPASWISLATITSSCLSLS